jgi:G:T-mismatch repair DNA endonuclease (very short patch repair protein)
MTGTDNLSPEDRRRTMKSVRSQNTIPEQIVRRILFRLS